MLSVPGNETVIDVEFEEWGFVMELLCEPDLGRFFGKAHAVRSIADYLSRFFPKSRTRL